ncbi:hypothetical protein H2203_006102 [Taxawa tesnikishii (nom. ined.)]|nr:hypothetical protein H2203_006102 [Dothideales sp. JES 119]
MSEQQPLLRPVRSPSLPHSNHTFVATTRRQTRRYLSSKTGHYSVLLLVSLDVACIFADFIIQIFRLEGRIADRDGEVALEALGIVSLVFSCLFVAELVASVWAFGFGYFRSKFHCFDALVITASFVIDVLLRGVLEEVATLVIVLRLWRVFKIIEELSVGAEEQMEGLQERLELVTKEKEALANEVEALRARLGEQV